MKKKDISKTVPIQSIIPRSLYVELVKHCAENALTIKAVIKILVQDFIKNEKFLYREWEMSDEQFNKASNAYDTYIAIRDEVERIHKEKEKKQ